MKLKNIHNHSTVFTTMFAYKCQPPVHVVKKINGCGNDFASVCQIQNK